MEVALSLPATSASLNAARPLFDAGLVDALLWSPETGWGPLGIPDEITELLQQYGERGGLYGHGVAFSLLTAGTDNDHHSHWLTRMAAEVRQRRYQHFSEHFGFMITGQYRRGAPLPVPMTHSALKLGQDRLRSMQEVIGVPVGLENLALAFSATEALAQGNFVDQMISAVNGFVVLDLHNLYCQKENFALNWTDILASWPLEKVREIHVSGGSWSNFGNRKIRRDTHDSKVPDEVWDQLPLALAACVNCQLVTLEQVPAALVSVDDAAEFRRDFMRLRMIVKGEPDVPCHA